MTNLATVQGIYESFGKGDIPAILDVLADDVEWESWADNSAVKAGVPWMVPRHGKAEAVHFFEAAAQMEIELAEDLRAEGYTVTGGRFAGSIPAPASFIGKFTRKH